MNRQIKYRNLFMFLVFVVVGALVISCAPKARPSASQLDTPEHHFSTGMKLLDQEKYSDAQREFDLAIQLSPKYSKAYAGTGLVKAYQKDYKSAFDAMGKAWKYADKNDEKIFVHVGYIRVNTMSRAECMQVGVVCKNVDNDWLDISKGEFDKAILIDSKAASAYYFMGLCYKTALDLGQAGQMFSKVLDLKAEYVNEADNQFQLVQKIQRAMPGTITGKQIAFVERITRADAAALFMEEMKIDVLYKKRTPKAFDTGFKDPEKAKTTGGATAASATDIASHPLKADIESILQIGVRGLEKYPDGTFRPNDYVDRATYAMMIEDMLIKVSGDNSLATKFIGSTSPFPDLRSDLPYFNAVMVVTSRGIMQAKDLTSGEFGAMGPVPGVDALLIIRKIKEELKFF
jgi:Tfp pilus assembly protein PilF